eukprot:3935099-Rhodomonas_salina.1
MKPIYMPGKPTGKQLKLIRRAFTLRRGINDIGLTVDGTYVLWRPDDRNVEQEFCNYKNQYSVLCMMFVNSYYLFMDGDV